ncbi:PspC domain-containing protein [Parashewanella tropica]|uniref:PspC domain-containing protein n=1 Tax=Parashewanella tropica TaxID=2547970 RepID=UPI0010594463|nr:PspC domain-containing protein [Parashewanella tropica]
MLDKIIELLKSNRLIFGTAARVSERYCWPVLWTRMLWLVCAIFAPFFALLSYIVVAVWLPSKERR